MSRAVKILIGYDGSPCADIALNDLQRAGLPHDVEATVLSVADIWLLPTDAEVEATGRISPIMQQARATAAKLLEEAHALEQQGAEVLQKNFPNWQVRAQAFADSPAWGIVLKAEEWQPNLVIVGSHSRSPIGRLMLGSVSHTVITQVHCSVRVARA